MLTVGVVADTHVPDRARFMNPKVVSILCDARVSAILHAGDVCSRPVLAQLGEIAPLYAVRGNRDVWQLAGLPSRLTVEFEGVAIGLTHGHGGFLSYLSQKLCYFIRGYQFHYYQKRLRREFPSARVIVFGHTHRSENRWAGNVLIFNPGPASNLRWGSIPPSVGLLHFPGRGRIQGEIVPLDA